MQEFAPLLSYGVYTPLDPAIVAEMPAERRALYDAAVESHTALDAADAALADAQAAVTALEKEASELDHIRKHMPRRTFMDEWRASCGRK